MTRRRVTPPCVVVSALVLAGSAAAASTKPQGSYVFDRAYAAKWVARFNREHGSYPIKEAVCKRYVPVAHDPVPVYEDCVFVEVGPTSIGCAEASLTFRYKTIDGSVIYSDQVTCVSAQRALNKMSARVLVRVRVGPLA